MKEIRVSRKSVLTYNKEKPRMNWDEKVVANLLKDNGFNPALKIERFIDAEKDEVIFRQN